MNEERGRALATASETACANTVAKTALLRARRSAAACPHGHAQQPAGPSGASRERSSRDSVSDPRDEKMRLRSVRIELAPPW
jgi:hypothetical protein